MNIDSKHYGIGLLTALILLGAYLIYTFTPRTPAENTEPEHVDTSGSSSANNTYQSTTSFSKPRDRAREIIELVTKYFNGEEVNASDTASLIKDYVSRNTTPVVYGDKALFIYVGKARSVSVPGDWNGWDPSIDHMVKLTSDLWVLLKEFPVDARLDYKLYVDGKWMLDPYNPRTVMGGFGPNSELVMPGHVFPPWYDLSNWSLKGVLEEYRIYNDYTGREHVVEIYKPIQWRMAEYIVYFYDGGDYVNLCSAYKIIDYLIAENKIPPVIAVFVHVSDPRNRIVEYGDSMNETDNFLVNQVIPFIEERLVLENRSVARVIVGDSLAGSMATYTLARHPDIFRQALIQSPAYWYSWRFFEQVLLETDLSGCKVFVDYGVYEGDRFIHYVNETVDQLMRSGALVKAIATKQGHSWGQWREYLGYGLIWLLGEEGVTE